MGQQTVGGVEPEGLELIDNAARGEPGNWSEDDELAGTKLPVTDCIAPSFRL